MQTELNDENDFHNSNNRINKKLLSRMIEFAKPFKKVLAISFFLMLIYTTLQLIRPLIIGKSIDKFIKDNGTDLINILIAGGVFLGTVIVTFIVRSFNNYILGVAGQRVIHKIRLEVYEKIIRMPINYFDKTQVGKLVTRATNDIDTLSESYTAVFVEITANIILMTGTLIILITLNLKLALAAFSVLPLIVISAIIFRKFALENFRKIRVALSALNTFLSEHIQAMKIIRLFNVGNQKEREFKDVNSTLNKAYINEVNIFGLFRPSIHLFHTISTAIVIVYGGQMINAGTETFGGLFIFFYCLGLFFFPINEMAEYFGVIQSATASAERIFEILKLEDESISNGTEKINQFKGQIEFENVWFAYKDDEWVLKDISFKIEQGSKVAFVGATGSGKSTIVQLILGFYKIQKGRILIDGIDMELIEKSSLRNHIGMVMQDVFLFGGTIKDNISLRNPAITDDDIEKYSTFVNADKFINSLPDGYNSPVVERGLNFSNGQRQLISFARALSFNPSLIILDEATASIDSVTENLIRDAIDRMIKDRTAIMIAHRLSTIRDADIIIVIHKGTIRESGTHNELLSQKGLYHNLIMAKGIT